MVQVKKTNSLQQQTKFYQSLYIIKIRLGSAQHRPSVFVL